MTDLEDFATLHGHEGAGVKVCEHTSDTRLAAAADLLASMHGVVDMAAIQWLADKATKSTFREHTTAPDESDCDNDCRSIGWWCENGDGEPKSFWWFDYVDAEKAAESVQSEEEPTP